MKNIFLLILSLPFIASLPISANQNYRVIDTYPIDDTLFIQGLELFQEKQLLISSGRYEQSMTLLYDIETQELELVDYLENQYFAEGITQTKDSVWQLTWREKVIIKRDPLDLSIQAYIPYEEDGWGIAYDRVDDSVWTSDGSSQLIKRNAQTLEKLEKITVIEYNQPVENINELEMVEGYLYANVWQTNEIIKIDPSSGQVTNKWDIKPLIDEIGFNELDPNRVLNGIAHYKDNMFFISGKKFPKIWLIELNS